MALGLYKPGQGYWVRVMTAVAAGLLILATAAWLWKIVEVVPLPTTGWNLAVRGVTGQAAEGQAVDLVSIDPVGGDKVIGHATVKHLSVRSAGDGTLEVHQTDMFEKYDPTSARKVVSAGGAGAAGTPAFSATVLTAQRVQLFETLYLQAGAASLVILIGFVLTYWLVGIKPETNDFLIATDAEMKKVNWSTKREIYGSTIVVIAAAVLIAAFLFLVDFLFSQFFRLIGVLQ
jgi:preprotein translocase subunit SecE